MKPVCDDCQRSRFIDVAGEPVCHAFCSFCGIKRACFGDDPDPIRPRIPRAVKEWIDERGAA